MFLITVKGAVGAPTTSIIDVLTTSDFKEQFNAPNNDVLTLIASTSNSCSYTYAQGPKVIP